MVFPLKPPFSYVVGGVLSMCQPMSSTDWEDDPSDQLCQIRRDATPSPCMKLFHRMEALKSGGKWTVYGWFMDGEWSAFKIRFVGISSM